MTFVINNASGTNDKDAELLLRRVHSTFPGAKTRVIESAEELADVLPQLVREEPDIIVAAGGDGTVNAVASQVAGTEKILGVIPLGTFNHFARDLKVPQELDDALHTIGGGKVTEIDAGQAGAHLFINNSSLGFYPRLVRFRNEQQRCAKRGKWLAAIRATFATLYHLPIVDVRLSANGTDLVRRTTFVFIGNNRYQLERVRFGSRYCLTDAVLSVFVAHAASRWKLFRLAVKALFGRLHLDKDFEVFCLPEVWISTDRRPVSVSFDGEVLRLNTPLHYRVWPKALRVIVPDETDVVP